MRRRALITGAARRVGRAIALELAGAGFDVAIHHRSRPDEAADVVAEARARGADAWALPADLASVEGCEAVVAAVAARWDTLDLLVNNASTFEPVPFAQISAAQWQHMMDVHARAPFLLSQGLLSRLAASSGAAGSRPGEGGLVVHLVDVGADRPVAGYAHYSVSKAALAMLVKAMAVELAPAVRTLGVSPGQVIWPEDYPEALRAKIAQRIPMGRVGEPEDVARLVRFLATEAPYLNGNIIDVDGGLAVRYG